MKKITTALIIITVAFGMVGCEKEPEVPKINIKRSTFQEIEASMSTPEATNKTQPQSGNKKSN